MCFTALPADSDEGIDDSQFHFVVEKKKKKKNVWFSDWGREDYSDLFKHTFDFHSLKAEFCSHVWLPLCCPSLSFTLGFGRFSKRFEG